MKTTYRAWGLVALLVLLCPLMVAAQKSAKAQGPYHSVEIQVKDLDTDQVIGTIQPGGTFTLNEGQKVRLIMTAIHPGQGKGPYYPETVFTENEPGRGWVRVARTSQENASVTLEIIRPSNANRNPTETLSYRITENVGIPNNLRQGTVNIHVQPLSAASGSAPVTSGSRTAQGLTNMLYRAILMRDMDPAGQGYIDRIAENGYPELVRVADEMARSEESRRGITSSNEQRLAALYQHLLGLTSRQIDQTQWNADLQRLNSGRLVDVVRDMIQSDRFLAYHNLSNERTAISRY
jgi:hypothetical protein